MLGYVFFLFGREIPEGIGSNCAVVWILGRFLSDLKDYFHCHGAMFQLLLWPACMLPKVHLKEYTLLALTLCFEYTLLIRTF